MSLSTNVSDLATSIATELKKTRVLVNNNATDLAALNTTAKTNLVAAINEVKLTADSAAGGGVAIDDDNASDSTTYSSEKIEQLVADVEVDLTDLIDDETASEQTVYSSTKTDSQISAAVDALVADAPGALDTLNELAASLADNADFAGTMTTALALKAPLASPTFTGTPAGPTATAGTNTTQLATTAFVTTNYGDSTTNFVTVFEAGLE